MEVLIEQVLIYGIAALMCLGVLFFYLRSQKRTSKITGEKIEKAKLHGFFEPVSLHPVIDGGSCINCGSCVTACPEKDILGIIDNRATTINASNCVGHGACFHACPVEAITLVIGTEKRGVDLPHVNQSFETNIPGIYIAGELGGMGLIRNAVKQGQQAVENLLKKLDKYRRCSVRSFDHRRRTCRYICFSYSQRKKPKIHYPRTRHSGRHCLYLSKIKNCDDGTNASTSAWKSQTF